MAINCKYNYIDEATGLNACKHPNAEGTVGRLPSPGVCEMCLKEGNGDPLNLFGGKKRTDKNGKYIPVPAKKKKVTCEYLGDLVKKGGCACGDGDQFVCNNPDASDWKKEQTIVRREDCWLCPFNESKGEEEEFKKNV